MKEIFVFNCDKHDQEVKVIYEVKNHSVGVWKCQMKCINCPVQISEKMLFHVLEDFETKFINNKETS